MRQLAGLAIACCVTGAAQAAPRDGGDDLVDREVYRQGAAPLGPRTQDWRTQEFRIGETANGAVDRLRVTRAQPQAGAPPVDAERARFEADAYDIAVIRDWAGVNFEAGAYDLRLAPHAGLGVTNAGGQAEAGAVLTLGQRRDDAVKSQLSAMGVQDGAAFGDQGRWYLFAAASGRAVGLNMLRGDGGWDRAGWSTDTSSKLIGDAQIGVGFRKGAMQTSFGLIHREVKGEHRIWGQETKDDTLAAFSLSIRPR